RHKLGDVVRFMAERGFTNFVVVKRRDQFEMLHINDAETRSGEQGSIIFMHDAVFPRLAAAVYAEAAAAQQRLVKTATVFAGEAERRLATLDGDVKRQLQEATLSAEARLNVLEEQEQALEAYLRLSTDGAL